MLEMDNSLLLIVDVQGKLATLMQDPETYLNNLKILIKGAEVLGLPIIWAEQLPDKLGATLPEIAELLTDYQPVAKSSFSCFGNNELRQALSASGKNQILVTGIETHICVYQTALDLIALNKEAHIVCDAVSSRIATNKIVGLEKMNAAGAQLTSTETCLFELMKNADIKGFKQLAQLLK